LITKYVNYRIVECISNQKVQYKGLTMMRRICRNWFDALNASVRCFATEVVSTHRFMQPRRHASYEPAHHIYRTTLSTRDHIRSRIQ